MSLTEGIIPKAVSTVKASAVLASQDVSFHSSVDQDLNRRFKASSASLLLLANRLLRHCNRDFEEIKYEDFIESLASWKQIESTLDASFEQVEYIIDKMKKGRQSNQFTYLEQNHSETLNFGKIEKPQKYFKEKVDNSDSRPFQPKLTHKPHAILPLNASLQSDNLPKGHCRQPYEQEIMESPYPDSISKSRDVTDPVQWDSAKAVWIDLVPQLRSMISALKGLSEIAVDLEHHDFHSYYGITCLMQISNRSTDWLVDTIALRDELVALNEIFADPKIVKVFHGANMDIIWLQRDLGLYVVSLFDTYHASKVLGFPKFSLAYLLETFAKFKTSKKYQLADWRIRPLPEVLVDYARADTHFLLSIFDKLINLLIEKGAEKLQDVLHLSRLVACRKFEYKLHRIQKEELSFFEDRDSDSRLIAQNNIPENRKVMAKELLDLRDTLAREKDESTRFIMSNMSLVNLCSLQQPVTLESLKLVLGKSYDNFGDKIDLVLNILNTPLKDVDTSPKLTLGSLISTARHYAELFSKIESTSPLVQVSKSLLVESSKIVPDLNIDAIVSHQQTIAVAFEEFAARPEVVDPPKQHKQLEENSRKRELVEESNLGERNGSNDSIRPLKRRLVNTNRQKKASTEDEAVFNYEQNQDSILKPDDMPKKQKSYDTFSKAATSGPKPKGRKAIQNGKSASFSRKR